MIKLSDDLKHRFVNALTDGVAMVVGYVDRNGDPHVSPYGSLHASGDDQLSLWVRNPQGDLIEGIARNANVAIFYDLDSAAGREADGTAFSMTR